MKYVIIIVRVLLGLMFAIFGSNAFLHFIPMPPMQGQAGAFIGALVSSGYIYVIALLQVIGGLLLLIGARFVPFGLTLLGPVIVNIMLYHIFLDTNGLPMACVISIFALFLLWVYRFKFPAFSKRKLIHDQPDLADETDCEMIGVTVSVPMSQ
jgi:putative oxidoreductase